MPIAGTRISSNESTTSLDTSKRASKTTTLSVSTFSPLLTPCPSRCLSSRHAMAHLPLSTFYSFAYRIVFVMTSTFDLYQTPQDGNITTDELLAFFSQVDKEKEAKRRAKFWLKEIDFYGDNSGYINPVSRAASRRWLGHRLSDFLRTHSRLTRARTPSKKCSRTSFALTHA